MVKNTKVELQNQISECDVLQNLTSGLAADLKVRLEKLDDVLNCNLNYTVLMVSECGIIISIVIVLYL